MGSKKTTSVWTGFAQLPYSIAKNTTTTIWGTYTYDLTAPVPSSVIYTEINYITASIPGPRVTISIDPAALVIATFTATLHVPSEYDASVEGVLVPTNGLFYPLTSAKTAGTSTQPGIVGESSTTTVASGTSSASSAQSVASSTLSATGITSSSTQSIPISTSSSVSKNQYSTGDIAGAAVGCFIGGVLIAGILAFFVLRRRLYRKKSNLSRSNGDVPSSHIQGRTVPVASGMAWEKHLPQSESDQTIRNLASRSLDQIELHVENYYRDAMALPFTDDVKFEIQSLDKRHLAMSTLQLIQQTHRPIVVIKHCIASLIISKIMTDSGSSNEDGSFLPTEFRTISHVDNSREVYSQAASRLRVLTSYLRPAPEHDKAYHEMRDRAILETARQIGHAFGPWARGNESARHQNLVNIMTRATEFGLVLFAQPALFEWQWEKKDGGGNDSREIVALPGLYKTVDQYGNPILATLRLLEPRVEKLGSQKS